MDTNRRVILRYSMTGAAALGMLGGGLITPPAYARKATLFTLVFISKRLDASTADYRKWYIEHHAPDFLTFGRPFLKRYTQDFVENAHTSEVDFDCISEFGYRKQGDQEALMTLTATPEAQRALAADPKIGSKPGPHEDHSGSRTFSVTEQLLVGSPRGYDPPGTKKQAILLRDNGSPSPEDFALGARSYATGFGRGAERVVLNLAVREADRPPPLFDAIIQIWPGKEAYPIDFISPPYVKMIDTIDLLSYDSNLGAL
jgi:hypothetical protein